MSSASKTSLKTAVVHDWLTGMRGGEVVLEALLDMYPDADLFTLLHNPGSVSEKIENRRIFTSFIDKLPFKKSRYRHYLPLFPTAIETFDFHGYDLVISSSHCVARGVIVPPGTPHLCFFHSPMRYVWDMYRDYFPDKGFVNRWVIPFFSNYLRVWDVSATPRVDAYVSNSAFVGERIRRYYGKTAEVVYPPCIPDKHQVPATPDRKDFYLIVSAFAPYKRIDLALEAFRDWDRRLVVVGGGQDEKKLRNYQLPNVRFMGNLSTEGITELYRTARGLIFPGQEDFGIVPVEAQSHSCPVIAFGSGGALETVVAGKTGVFFTEQNVDALREAIIRNEKNHYKREDFQKNIERFTGSRFSEGIASQIKKIIGRG